MRENLTDLVTFLSVVKEGSFTKAAAKAGTSQSAVSQTVSNLEQRLKLKLLNRTTRSLTLTEAGEKLVALINPAIEDISTGLEQLINLRDTPAGTIRISADEYAIQQVLWPKLAPVLKNYPDIKLELITDYGLVDIAKERFDAGVRRGGLIAKDMIAIPISAEHQMAVIASTELLKQYSAPAQPADLLQLPCINLQLPTHGDNFPWVFKIADHEHKIRVKGQLVVNGINQAVQAALDGYGFAYVPRTLVTTQLQQQKLVTVLDHYAITYPGYYLYYTSRLQSSAAFSIIVNALRYRR
ncbi:LysR family transcriptional regulator [Rheinheimera sp. NSM]|uniref:LysR family transcriptional regulator n=1 Tax=Rheinheimera sp. NSM TaxID=3457884 RepID=UPI004035BBDB